MANWGSESWGQDSWSADAPAPVPPEPAGDGHICFVASLDQTGPIGAESAQIEIWPIFDLAAGFVTWTWHFLGEAFGISAGKTLTFKIYRNITPGGSFTDPVIGSAVVSANGLFHVQFTATIPNGSYPYMQSRQSDSLTGVFYKGFLTVVEAYP